MLKELRNLIFKEYGVIHKVTDEQATAQAEFDHFIATQAQAIAPEPLTTVEINFYHHEVYCGKELIGYRAIASLKSASIFQKVQRLLFFT